MLATQVYVGFERTRFRVVTAPRAAHGPALTIPLPDLTPLAGHPAAVVIHIGGATEPLGVTLAVDGQPFAEVRVDPGPAKRADFATDLPAGPGHQFVATAPRGGWQVEYLEIANVHGFSRGLVEFVIIPRQRAFHSPFPPALLIALFIGLTLAAPRPQVPNGRATRVLYRAVAGIILLFFAVLLVSHVFSGYRILLSLKSAVYLLLFLYADPVIRGWRRTWRAVGPWLRRNALRAWHSRAGRATRPVLIHALAAIFFLGTVAQFYAPGVGFTSLIKFGETFHARALPALQQTLHEIEPTPGYDGQFYAQLALDPLLRTDDIRTALDSPAYRARRILLPWLAFLMGAGQPWWVLQAYALLNVLSWCVLAWLLLQWLPPGTVRPALAWLACMFSHGLLTSVREALPDGPSVLLIALGIRSLEAGRAWLGTWILGLAGLCRETNVLGAVALLPRGTLRPGAVAMAALRGAIVAVPLLLWLAYLWSIDLPAQHAGAGNFGRPLASVADKWLMTIAELRAKGWDSFTVTSLLSLIALTTQAAFLLLNRSRDSAWWRIGVVYLALMVVLGPAVWQGYPGAATRVVLPMTFAFNVLVVRSRWFWPLWLLGNANALRGLEAIHAPVFGPGRDLLRPFG